MDGVLTQATSQPRAWSLEMLLSHCDKISGLALERRLLSVESCGTARIAPIADIFGRSI